MGCQKSSPGSRRRWCWTEWAVEKVFLWAVTSLEQTVIAATVGSDHTASYSITPDSAMRLSLLKDPRLICLHESWSSCKYAAVHCSENSISLKASSKTFELGDLLLTSFEACGEERGGPPYALQPISNEGRGRLSLEHSSR